MRLVASVCRTRVIDSSIPISVVMLLMLLLLLLLDGIRCCCCQACDLTLLGRAPDRAADVAVTRSRGLMCVCVGGGGAALKGLLTVLSIVICW